MKKFFTMLILLTGLNNLYSADLKLLKSFNISQATINTYNVENKAIIHSFIDSFVYAYVIETDNNVIIIDTLTSTSSGTALLNFALSLNKPVAGVFLTHGHGDHIGGIEAFTKYTIYSLPDTQQDVITKFNKDFNNIVLLKVGEEIKIDNLVLKVGNIEKAHINSHLILMISQINTIVVGDLVVKDFIKQHPLIKDFDAFLSGLEYLKSLSNFDHLLTGHTEIVNTSVLADNIKYVTTGKTQYAKSSSPQDYITRMHQFYPANRNDDLQVKFLSEQ